MKRTFSFIAGFLGVLMMTIVSADAADPDTMYVRYIEGAVSLSGAGSPQAMEAVVNTPLIEGDIVAAGPGGRAELFLKDGSIVRAGSNTVMKIVAIDDKGVRFKIEQGTAYIVSRGSKEVRIFFDTPLAALDITSPSTVRIDAYSNGINEISVLKGGIFAAQSSGRMLVREGERLVLKADGSMPSMAALRAPDEWLRWNAGRNTMTFANAGSSNSYTYLPEELKAYSSDLDANGQWIYTPEYDYVWIPTVITVGTWSPYRYGRWAWIRGSYVWVGYEPWGWAPYHYGRWVHHGRAGWCWVPPRHRDVRWEPAHVAWINSSRHVGWVPLAPGERYDRRNAPVINQANIYNTTYRNVTIERSAAAARTSYRNVSVANSMITVESDRMLGRKTMIVAAANKGTAMLKKVSLPANVTPTRAKGGVDNRQITERKAAAAVRSVAAPSVMSGMASKSIAVTGAAANISPAPVSQPPGTTRQLSDRSLNSRIENARTSPLKDDRIPGAPRPESQSVASARKLSDTRQQAGSPAGRNNTPPARVMPAAPPAKEPAQAVRINTVNPALPANQMARPVKRQPSPVVSASPQPSAPNVSRQPQAPGRPLGTPAPQAVSQPRIVSSKTARDQAPKPTVNPAPRAAAPAKPVPAPGRPAKNDNNSGPDKNNNRPHA